MSATNFIVTSLPDYVQTNRDILLKNFALVGTDTRRRIGLQTGIKESAAINFLDVVPTLQSGKACGFDAAGDVTLTQRVITTAAIKVNIEICAKNLIGKYAEYLVRINANEEDLPFERYIVDGIVANINKKIEKLIWLGDTSQTSDADLKWIDGFLEIASDESDVIDVNIGAGTSAYDGIVAVYMAMPDEAIERGGLIFVSPSIYKQFIQEMVALNYFHYAPNEAVPGEFYLPGTDVRVVKTPGLAGSLKILGTFGDNLIYGCDMEGDDEDVVIRYNDLSETFLLKVLWNSGVQIAFPNLVVLGTFADTPTSPKSTAQVLAGVVNGDGDAINIDINDQPLLITNESSQQ